MPTPPGGLDSGFGSGGLVSDPGELQVVAAAVQADGKIVLAGSNFTPLDSTFHFGLTRYNADGTVDTGFGTGGLVVSDLYGVGGDAFTAVALQADGKIVAAGYTYDGSQYDFAVLRFLTDGSLDATFGTGGKVATDFSAADDQAHGVAIQGDGKIVVAGSSVDLVGGTTGFAVARYDSDGTLDSGFGTGGKVVSAFGGGANDIAYALALQGDGKIVAVGGSLVSLFGDTAFAVLRYTTAGALDSGFGTGGIVTTLFAAGDVDTAAAVAIQGDGKIVAVGSAQDAGAATNFALARYNDDGTLDSGFGTAGLVKTVFPGGDSTARGVLLDGTKIVAAGTAPPVGLDPGFALARYNADGSLDATFGTSGLVTEGPSGSPTGTALVLASDGDYLVAGFGGGPTVALAEYLGATPAISLTPTAVQSTTAGIPGVAPAAAPPARGFSLFGPGCCCARPCPIKVCVKGCGGGALPGATVTIKTGGGTTLTSGITGRDGCVTLSVPSADTYTVVISATNYNTFTGSHTFDCNDTFTQQLTFSPPFPTCITFRVGGCCCEALEGATIAIDGTTLTTDADGEADWCPGDDGTYPYTVSHAKFQDKTGSISIDMCGFNDPFLNICLVAASGYVCGFTSSPIPIPTTLNLTDSVYGDCSLVYDPGTDTFVGNLTDCQYPAEVYFVPRPDETAFYLIACPASTGFTITYVLHSSSFEGLVGCGCFLTASCKLAWCGGCVSGLFGWNGAFVPDDSMPVPCNYGNPTIGSICGGSPCWSLAGCVLGGGGASGTTTGCVTSPLDLVVTVPHIACGDPGVGCYRDATVLAVGDGMTAIWNNFGPATITVTE